VPRKSLVQRSQVDHAKAAHSCQASSKHRLKKGDVRLKVYVSRSQDHYCLACALAIVSHDIQKLQELATRLREAARATDPANGSERTSEAGEHDR
jgi:hypothetical protein